MRIPVSITSVAVLLALLAILLGPISLTEGDSSDCCNGISSECQFLCSGSKPGFLTRTRCRFRYLAKVKTCEAKNKIDYVKKFGQQLTMSAINGLNVMKESIKEKLLTVGKFVQLTVEELLSIPQDVLGGLQEGIQDMTPKQFIGIVKRLKLFTKQNLHSLLSKIPVDTFTAALTEINVKFDFDNDQLREMTLAGFRAFGKNVGNWSSDVLNKMNKLLAGLETSEIIQIAGDGLKISHQILCDVNFADDQKKALFVPVKKAFGEIADWDETAIQQICKVLEVIPPTQLLEISVNTISKSVKFLKDKQFFVPQTRVILGKLKESWANVNEWDDVKIKELGELLKGIDKEDIKGFVESTVKKALAEIGKVDWNEDQAREWIKKAKSVLGNPEKWTTENIRDLGKTAVGILPGDLQKIANTALYNAMKHLKDVEVHIDQAQALIEKIKEVKKLSDLDKDDLVAMQKIFDGFLASDVGKLTHAAVLAAFPELIIAKKIGMPILREFIKHYKANPDKVTFASLRDFAKVLTRVELNQTDIKKITTKLQSLGIIEWDATQAFEIMQRLKNEWGDFNGTDDDYHDRSTWDFKKFAELGTIVLGFTKDDLRNLPIRGIEDIIEVLGQNKGWGRGQVIATMERLREYWIAENLDLTNLTETDINGLGQFVSGLALSELRKLPQNALHTVIRRLGENMNLPEDKLRSRAYLAIELLKNETGTELLTSLQVADLGSLLKGVNRDVLKKMTKEAFLDNIYKLSRIEGMSDDRLWQLVELAKEHFENSDVGDWLAEQWEDLGPAIKALNVRELRKISKKAFLEMVGKFGELDVMSLKQTRVLVEKAKDYWEESDVGKWTGEQLRQLGSLVKGLTPDEIRNLGKEAFKDAVGVWGERLDLDEITLKALAERAKQVFADSDLTKIAATHLKTWGRVVLGLTPDDLEKLNIDNIDVIAALGKWKGWSKEQIEKIAQKVKEFLAKAKNPDYYMSLGHLSSILDVSDIKLLKKDFFERAVKQFGVSDTWSKEQLKALADKAKVTWGTSDLWQSSQLSELGNIVEGMKPSDLNKLNPIVLNAIKPEVFGKLEDKQVKEFSEEQFRAMDSAQVSQISEATLSYLTKEQRAAVQTVKDSDPDEPDPWPQQSCYGSNCNQSSGEGKFLPSILLILTLFSSFLYYIR